MNTSLHLVPSPRQ